ncbi:MAG: DNA polymerase Y family protein [Arenimonas sp.]
MTLRSLFVDFNSYFASVEQQENPSLRNRPVVVVPVVAETTCCIAASVEAKKYGIKTGTIVSEARNRCPDLVVMQAHPALYVTYHKRLMDAIESCIPRQAASSIDEVECLLIGREREPQHAIEIAHQIKQSVKAVGDSLRCSIGIAPNGFLAKTASDMQKPDGLVVIEQKNLPDALFGLKLGDLCGVGYNMEKRLRHYGIHSIEQLCYASRAKLREVWGSIEGERFHDLLRGEIIERPKSKKSSIGHSHVLAPELRNTASVNAVLKKLLMKAAMRMRGENLLASHLHVRVKYLGFDAWEVSERMDATDDSKILLHRLIRMLAQRKDTRKPLAVAVTLTGLIEREGTCPSLFSEIPENPALTKLLDTINKKYGNNKMYFGSMQSALDSAPMRISFNRIPDVSLEDESEKNELWMKRINQFRVLAEAEHKKHDTKRLGQAPR